VQLHTTGLICSRQCRCCNLHQHMFSSTCTNSLQAGPAQRCAGSAVGCAVAHIAPRVRPSGMPCMAYRSTNSAMLDHSCKLMCCCWLLCFWVQPLEVAAVRLLGDVLFLPGSLPDMDDMELQEPLTCRAVPLKSDLKGRPPLAKLTRPHVTWASRAPSPSRGQACRCAGDINMQPLNALPWVQLHSMTGGTTLCRQ